MGLGWWGLTCWGTAALVTCPPPSSWAWGEAGSRQYPPCRITARCPRGSPEYRLGPVGSALEAVSAVNTRRPR